MVKLNVSLLKYMTREDFRVLTAVSSSIFLLLLGLAKKSVANFCKIISVIFFYQKLFVLISNISLL